MEAREEWIKFRCTVAEKRRFKELAAAEGTDVSALIRRRVFAGASEVPAPTLSMFDDEFAATLDPKPGVQFYSGTTSGPGWPE